MAQDDFSTMGVRTRHQVRRYTGTVQHRTATAAATSTATATAALVVAVAVARGDLDPSGLRSKNKVVEWHGS